MATPTSYVPLEGGLTQAITGKSLAFDTNSTPTLFTSTSFLYTLFFVVIVVVAASKYAQAGLLRMEASESGIKKSNEVFKKTTLGLLGVFSLWLILSTVNKDLLTGNVGLDALRSKSSGTFGGGGATGVISRPSSARDNPPIPANNDDPKGWDAIKNDSTVRKQLLDNNITVNKGVCNNPTQTSCTTVGGWPQETVTMLMQLRNTCSGGIEVTGGNEAGHSSHGPGKSPVDLSMNKPGNLNACISAFPAGPTLNYCKKTYVNFGHIFCDENGTPHWHVYKQ